MTPEEIQNLLNLAHEHKRMSNIELSNSFANEALLICQTSQYLFNDISRLKLESLCILAWNCLNQSNFIATKDYSLNILEIALHHNHKDYCSKAYNLLGNVYLNLSEYDKAYKNYSLSVSISIEIDDKFGTANVFGNIGNVFLCLSQYEKALEYYEKSLRAFEEISYLVGIANATLSIGNIFVSMLEYENAIEYYKNALLSFEEINDKLGIAISTMNIGNVLYNQQDYKSALELVKNSLEQYVNLHYKVGIANSNQILGNIYVNLLEYNMAFEYYSNAMKIFEEIGNRKGVASIKGNLGEIYLNTIGSFYDLAIAEEYLFSAFTIAKEIGEKYLLLQMYANLSNLRSKQGLFEESLEYYKTSVSIEKEILSNEATKRTQLFNQSRKFEEAEKDRQLKLVRFKEQERIFHNILPVTVANRLIEGEKTIADSYENVSIFFSDIVGFTTLSSKISPTDLVEGLNKIFTVFDRIGAKYGLEKIKTIGDAYMSVCGVPEPFEDHELRSANFALEIADVLEKIELGVNFIGLQIRIGLHCGNVVAGVIGERKFAYDVWGDAVNVASRMESNSEAGRIHISEAFAKSIEHHQEFKLIPRGEINIKGKGTMNTFWLEKAL